MLSTQGVTLALLLSAGSPASAPTLDTDVTLTGALESTDQTTATGAFADAHTVDLEAGQLLVAELRAAGFVGKVQARSPGGEVFSGAAGKPGSPARLELWAPVSGRWVVQATSVVPGELGTYSLALNVSGDPLPGSGWPRGHVAVGRLGEPNDAALASGEFLDTFRFTGRPGDLLELDVRGEFPSFLALIAPGGAVIRDEEALEGKGSRIRVQLPEAGTYTIAVTSDAAGEAGAYTVKVLIDRPSAREADPLTLG